MKAAIEPGAGEMSLVSKWQQLHGSQPALQGTTGVWTCVYKWMFTIHSLLSPLHCDIYSISSKSNRLYAWLCSIFCVSGKEGLIQPEQDILKRSAIQHAKWFYSPSHCPNVSKSDSHLRKALFLHASQYNLLTFLTQDQGGSVCAGRLNLCAFLLI